MNSDFNVATFRGDDGRIYFDHETVGNTHIPVPNPLPPITNDMLNEDRGLMQHQKDLVERMAARRFFVGDFPDTDCGKSSNLIPICPPEDRVHRAGVNYTELIAQVAREWATAKIREGYTPTISKAGLKLVEHKLEWLVQAERHMWSPSTYQPPEPEVE